MRVALHGFDPTRASGPNVACARLARELERLGVTVLRGGSSCDVDLVNVAAHTPRRGRATVQRLDGLWTRADQRDLNEPIRATWSTADAVIAQSAYDAAVAAAWFGERAGVSVVHNGAPSLDRTSILDRVRRKRQHVAVACAAWHPQKRFSACVEVVASMRRQGLDAGLVVVGTAPITEPAADADFVEFVGDVTPAVAAAISASADSIVHLAWRDHCPNAVVEALAAGTQAIVAGSGGTPELAVRSGGVIIPESALEFDPALPFDYDAPPKIDCSTVDLLRLRPVLNREWFGIERMAREYLRVFEECLG